MIVCVPSSETSSVSVLNSALIAPVAIIVRVWFFKASPRSPASHAGSVLGACETC